MARVWRLLVILCVLAMIGPALAALVVIGWGRAEGCAFDSAPCGALDLGGAFAFFLEWAWRRVLDPLILAAYATGASIGAAYGWPTRSRAMLWSLASACWGPIAALVLPYFAVFASKPVGCAIIEGSTTDCILWGQMMGRAYDDAAIAYWLSVFIIPIGIGGLIGTFILASIRHRPAR